MRISALALAAVLASVLPVHAATTDDDAAKLKASLQAYLGAGADAVTIEPEDDGFNVTVKLSELFTAAKRSDVGKVEVSDFDFTLTPEGNGKWKVERDDDLEIHVKSGDQLDMTEKFESFKMDGEFDEALGAFSKLDIKAGKVTFTETMDDGKGTTVKADGSFDAADFSGTAASNPTGGVDLKFTESIGAGGFTEDVGMPGNQPVHVDVKTTGGSFNGSINGVKTLAVLQTVKFVVGHNDDASFTKDQATFKSLLSDVMPGFSTSDVTGSLNALEVQSPIGPFKAAKLNVSLKANGAVKDGKIQEVFGVDGLELPPGLAPAWAASLVPKSFNFDLASSGFDLESFIKAELAAADFSKNPPIPKDVEDKNTALLLPTGAATVELGKSTFGNDTYTVTATGSMQAGPAAQPTGKAHITIKGLDDVMKAAQAAPPEAGLQQVTAVVVVAKGLAKPEGDALGWDIAATPDGKLTVNGMDMSQLQK